MDLKEAEEDVDVKIPEEDVDVKVQPPTPTGGKAEEEEIEILPPTLPGGDSDSELKLDEQGHLIFPLPDLIPGFDTPLVPTLGCVDSLPHTTELAHAARGWW